MKHTPEPWYVDQVFQTPIYITARTGKDGEGICLMDGRLENRAANAARIVACVNACAGMEDPVADIQALMNLTRRISRYGDGIGQLTHIIDEARDMLRKVVS